MTSSGLAIEKLRGSQVPDQERDCHVADRQAGANRAVARDHRDVDDGCPERTESKQHVK
jgi:hypothetical protein